MRRVGLGVLLLFALIIPASAADIPVSLSLSDWVALKALARGGGVFSSVSDSTVAGLPTPSSSNPHKLRRLTDGGCAGAIVVDDGANWRALMEKEQKIVNPACPPYNADITGAVDARAALASADTAAGATGTLLFTKGTYKVSSNLTLTAQTRHENGAILSPDAAVVITLSAQPIAGRYKIFTTGAGTIVMAFPQHLQRVVDTSWWGAVNDGTANDTAAVKAAIASIPSTEGGEVVLPGPATKLDDLALSARTKWLRISLRGQLALTQALTLPARYELFGSPGGFWGNDGTQFQQSPSAGVTTCSVAGCGGSPFSPLLIASGAALENLTFLGDNASGPVVRVLVGGRLHNVGVSGQNSAGVTGLELKGPINWVDMKRVVVNVGNSSDASLDIDAGCNGCGVGQLYVDHLNLSGKGIRMRSSVAGGAGMGDFNLVNVLLESCGTSPVITMDVTNMAWPGINGVLLNHVASADCAPSSFISVVGNTPTAPANSKINDLVLIQSGSTPLLDANASISGLHVVGGGYYKSDGYKLGTDTLFEYASISGKEFDGIDINRFGAFSPSMIPLTSEAVVTDPASWTCSGGTGCTVTTGITGPDGSTKAGRFSNSSGVSAITVLAKSVTPAVGDFVIAGTWIRQEGTIVNDYPQLVFNNSSNKLNGGTTFQWTGHAAQQISPASWAPVIGVARITAVAGGADTLNFKLGTEPTKTASFFMPYLVYVPASAGYTVQEIYRWAKSMTVVPPSAGAGTIAVLNESRIYGPVSTKYASLKHDGTNATLSVSGGALNLSNIGSISATSVTATNLNGTCTFVASTTCLVSFTNTEPNTNYRLALGAGGRNAYWWSNKSVTGFTINATSTDSNAVDWLLHR